MISASLQHPRFHCLSIFMHHVLRTPATVFFFINFNQSSLSTFLFDFDSGQLAYDGPLVGHCSVCICSAMATSWGPVRVCVGWTFEAPMLVQ